MARHRFLLSPFGEAHLELGDRTHIEATSGLAGDWALGWWHAHRAGDEAVFARDFWRGHLGSGGRSPGRTELATFVAGWSFVADLEAETNSLSKEQKLRVQAYADGFNHARRRSRELPWTPEDCHLLARTLGFLEWWEVRAPQIVFLLDAVREGLSWPRILDLWPELGPEPDRGLWRDVVPPPAFSAEAQALVNRLCRFRASPAWIIPGSRTQSGVPLLSACYVSDATDESSPFLPVRIDTPDGSTRGLSRPGHPGFLAGKTRWMAWHGVPAVDDCLDLRILDRSDTRTLAGVWAGSGRTGTLQGLLTLEETTTVEAARDRTAALGSACLDFAAADSRGATARWAQGPRWLRPSPRDSWLPSGWSAAIPVGSRRLGPEPVMNFPGRATATTLAEFLSRPESGLVTEILPSLRFLLPDTEAGQRLRRWPGLPPKGAEAKAFERLYEAVLDVFWEDSPVVPPRNSSVLQALLPAIDRLIQAPHSAWFPSTEKNLRLAEGVRRAFAPGRPEGFSSLGRRAVRPSWTEDCNGHTRTFTGTVALVADPAAPEWQVAAGGKKPNEFQSW